MTDMPVAEIKGDLEKYMNRLGSKIDKELVIALIQAAVHAEGELKQAINDLFSSGGTGQLARSPKATLLQDAGEVKSSGAFLDLIYADIQDQGGTIVPRVAKALSVPLTVMARKRYPREWQKGSLFLINSKRGNTLLVSQKGKGIEPHYLLKKSVRIRGKGYVERARRNAEEAIREIIGEYVGVAIKQTRPVGI